MRLGGLFVTTVALLAIACGGGDGDEPSAGGTGGSAPTGAGAAVTTAPTGGGGAPSAPSTGGSAPTGAATGGGGSAATGGGAPQAGADIDVCGLLTKAEVEAALNLPVIDAAAVEEPPFIGCSFNNVDFPALHRVRVSILVAQSDEEAQGIYQTLAGPNDVEVEGIGEAAAWADIVATLGFLEGRYNVLVSVPPIDGQGAQSIAEELAGLVASRLE